MRIRCATRALVLSSAISAALLSMDGAAEGDIDAGRKSAEQWCSRCHDIRPGGAAKQQPPAFAAIAGYRDPEHIRANILVPHGAMPQVAQVLGLGVDDLVAYIVSLERPCD